MKNKRIKISDNYHIEISIIPKEVRCTVLHGHTRYAVESVNPNHIAAYDTINDFLHLHCEPYKVREIHQYIERKITLKTKMY